MDITQKIILQNDIRLLEKEKKKLEGELDRLNNDYLESVKTVPTAIDGTSDVRIMEREKKKIMDELSRLNAVRQEEFKQFTLTKNSHLKILTEIKIKIDRLQQGFELLKKACEKAEKDLAEYNANELLQAKQKTERLLAYARSMQEEVDLRKVMLDQREESLKTRELVANNKESSLVDRDVVITQKEKDLRNKEEKLQADIEANNELLLRNDKNFRAAQTALEHAKKEEQAALLHKADVQKEIDSKFAEAAKIKLDAENTIKQYTILMDNLAKTKKEQEQIKVQLAEQRISLNNAIEEWKAKGVVLHG